jgi:putative ABC transport system substrate-binding protein
VISRRRFLTGFVIALAPAATVHGAPEYMAPAATVHGAPEYKAGKVYRIGFLRAGEPPKFWIDEFREGLRELGYVEGQNVVIEFRIGPLDQLPRLAEDLVRSKVDVIVASASSAGMAAKNATTSIPIVFTSLSHPVEIGLIKTLARPGGNITGVTVNAGATVTKRLELLRELVPGLKQVAVLMHPAHPTDPVQRKEMEEAARALGLQLKPAAVRAPEDFEAAFKAVSGAGGLLNIDTPLFTTYRTQFVELAARNRLPAIWSNGIIVEAGGLMSYGTYIPALFRRAATYVDKVLKGARPGDLPVEQPTKFELVINLKTAKALGLTIPPSLLLRADHLIE